MDNFLQLASNQRDIWQDQAAYPDSPVYNIGGTFVIDGEINYKQLNLALKYLIIEHDSLRIAIHHNSPNNQVLLEKIELELEFIDFSKDEFSRKKSHQWLDYQFTQAFDLKENSLLWQFALIKESEKRYYLMQKFHHVIADGWSTTVVIERLAEIYRALLQNKEIEKKSSTKYLSFIQQEQIYLNSSAYQTDQQYWKQLFPELPPSLITPRYPNSEPNSLAHSNVHRLTIPRSFYNKINLYSIKHKSTCYHSFLTALAIYFSRIYQRNDIIIGIPSLNRNGAKYKDVIGMFISLSPLVLNIEENASSSQILTQCKTSLRELYRHQRFPLGSISKHLKLLQNGQNSLFDILLSYEKHDYSADYIDAKVIKVKQQCSGIARYPLAISICEFDQSDDVEVLFEAAETCFSSDDLQALSEHLLLILEQMLTSDLAVKDIQLLTEKDNNIIFNQFNAPKNIPEKKLSSVIDLFQEQVKKQPHAIALEFEEIKFSYQQLDHSSNQLAQYIINSSNTPPSIIALFFGRNIEMIVAILATLKVSAAYLPIPTDIPDERIHKILQQSQTTIVLSQKNYQERLQLLTKHIIYVDDFPKPTTYETETFPKNNPDSLAYVIFTSGSSGQPKGVTIDHTALSLRIKWLQSLFKLTPHDHMGQSIPYNFDPSIIEIFLSLTQGACLVLMPENHYTNEKFGHFIINKSITTIALVPSSIRMLLQTQQTMPLRVACCGGERLEPNLAKQFLEQTQAQLFNVYGPTESTIIASAWECRLDFSGNSLPIGIPAENTPIYITDSHLNILPINTIGEICITGKTLAKGYLHQLDLTEKSFLTWNKLNTIVYKTNDRGYIGHDGLLYFSDRLDRQVKINGYRIELGEVESLLQQHPDINIAAVITHKDNKQTHIYAYVEIRQHNTEAVLKELSLHLRQNLPNYMQPRKIIDLNSIAVTQTGKIDYSNLPIPSANIKSHTQNLPRNAIEIQLLTLWSKVLSTPEIGIYDNFFEFGGDSLTAINLMIAIEKYNNVRYPLSFLLEHPTIAEQSTALQKTYPKINILNSVSNHPNIPNLFIAVSGHGDILRLSNLANTLGNTCNIHILQPLEDNPATTSINHIAQQYAECIIISRTQDIIPIC